MKKLFTLALLAIFSMGSAMADTEVTFTLNDPTTIAALGITLPEAGQGTKVEELNKDGVKIVATTAGKTDTRIYQGSGNNAGKYDFRIYQNGTLTFTAGSYFVKKIVFTGNNLTRLSGDGYSTDTWAGSASSVTLTATSGTATIYTITVTFGEASGIVVNAPSISGTTPFIGSTEVTITNNTDGAKVYYTTNGDDPTSSSLEYSAPFNITETTTVKAIAVKSGTSSSVTSKTFTAVPSVANVAALNALKDKDVFAFAGEVQVVYVNGKYAYIKDETGSSLIFDNGSTKLDNLAVGKKIAANWTGKVSVYNNLFEAVPDAILAVTDAAAAEVVYPEVAITDIVSSNMNQLVVLKSVTYTALDGKNFTISKDGTDVKGYNQFGLEIAAPTSGKTYDITGVISVFKTDTQFQPINIVESSSAGVSAIKADVDANAPAYNVAGQKVAEGYKGLVIKGGKKVIQK